VKQSCNHGDKKEARIKSRERGREGGRDKENGLAIDEVENNVI